LRIEASLPFRVLDRAEALWDPWGYAAAESWVTEVANHPAPDLTGQTFGKLTVLERSGTTPSKVGKNSGGRAIWRVQCTCGRVITRTTKELRVRPWCGDCAPEKKRPDPKKLSAYKQWMKRYSR
jgi:hypothetical protein